MGKKANPTVIGGFIVGAVVLITAGLVVFGGTEFWSTQIPWVSYFPGSVKGLERGATVSFRGVDIGKVTDVRVVMNTENDTVLTPVYWQMDPSKLTIIGLSAAEKAKIGTSEDRPIADALIKRGLKASLQLKSFVTGQQFIELDFHPDEPITLVGGGDTSVPEFPTIRSGTEKLLKTVESLPIGEIADDARRVLKSLDQLVGKLESQTLPAVDQFFGKLESQTLPAAQAAMDQAKAALAKLDSQTLPAAQAAMDQAKETLASYGEGSPMNYELANTLKEAAGAARALRVLANYLERHPEALLQGKGEPGGNQK